MPLSGRNLVTLVFETGRPARIDDYSAASGPSADLVRGFGICAGVGVPISVEGRLWGAMMAMAREQPLPADTEARLADFTELVATALANAENQAQLTASRARIVAAADQARRRIERDLHDGAQQRLVSLGLHLRAAQAAVPPEAIELAARFDGLADEVTTALDELRELARGIHPAALAQGGLRPALKGLARRSAVPVKLDVRVDGRLPEQFETAAYYVVSEALTNAAKHAHASVVHVEADTVEDDGDGVLRVRVTRRRPRRRATSPVGPAWSASKTGSRRSEEHSRSRVRQEGEQHCTPRSRSAEAWACTRQAECTTPAQPER